MQFTFEPDGTLDSATLQPLPPVLKRGLMAVSFLGFSSFISSSTLLFYLTHKLIKWRWQGHACKGYNQFLLLIYNLLIADIQQSLAFLLTVRWLAEDKIDVRTSTCFAEGWFVSTGDLASGVWIFAIALHTFFAIVRCKKLPYSIFLSAIAGLWFFIYGMAAVGVISHRKNFYVRAGAWCWIAEQYAFERLWLHYFWIFVAMFGTIMLYTIIYSTLNTRLRPESIASTSSLTPLSSRVPVSDPRTINRAARYMIVYPTVYVLCTLPLAAGRMAAMTGHSELLNFLKAYIWFAQGRFVLHHVIPYWYYCFAGAAITSCGWLDVLLYSFTRRVLVFSEAPPPMDECGLETFGIFHSPQEFWNVQTVVEGGVLVDPTVSTRRRNQFNGNLSGDRISHYGVPSQDVVMDDTFDVAMPGSITTKTTITVTTEPRIVPSREDSSELSGPAFRPASKHDETPSDLPCSQHSHRK